MQSTDVHTLLGISHKLKRPHPYQIFGLAAGEQDPSTIRRAIAEQIDRLRSLKGSADPATWKHAAKLVTNAKAILLHPERKAELDARFGIVPETPADDVADDPLAGLLPPAPVAKTPESAVEVPEQAALPEPADLPEDIQQKDETDFDVATDESADPPDESYDHEPAIETSEDLGARRPTFDPPSLDSGGRTYRRRRRRSWLSRAVGTLAILGLVAIVGGVSYFALKGPGKIEIVRSDGQLTIRTGGGPAVTDSGDSKRQVSKTPVTRRQSDGILEAPDPNGSDGPNLSLADRTPAPSDPGATVAPADAGGNASRPPAEDVGSSPQPSGFGGDDPAAMPESGSASPATDETSMAGNGGSQAGSADEPSSAPTDSSGTPSGQPPTPEEIQAAEEAIAIAQRAVRGADWKSMKQLAETAETRALTPEQKQSAETLFQLADLATHYREAIRRGMDGLEFGNEFNLTETIKVLVVESSAESITIRHGAKNRSYPIDEIPLILADALAKLQLSDTSPTGRAARLTYRAVWPQSSPEHRTDAAAQLRQLGDVPGADPKKMADVIERLFQ